MSELPSKELTKSQQLAQIREWIAAAKGRTYRKGDKRRYVKLEYDCQGVTMPPSEAEDWIGDADGVTYVMQEVWMTEAQYNKLPEFEGF
jgi:hypothetical protein